MCSTVILAATVAYAYTHSICLLLYEDYHIHFLRLPLFGSYLPDRPAHGPVADCHLWHRLPQKTVCFFLASCGKWVSLLSPSSFSHTSLPSHACARTHNAHTCSTLYSPSCCRSQSWQLLGGISQSWYDSNWKIGSCVWGMWIIPKERGTEWITWLARLIDMQTQWHNVTTFQRLMSQQMHSKVRLCIIPRRRQKKKHSTGFSWHVKS